MCTFLFQCGVLWDVGQVHCGICEIGLFQWFHQGLDGVVQSDMLLNGGDSARDEVVYNIDQYSTYIFGHGAIRWDVLRYIISTQLARNRMHD